MQSVDYSIQSIQSNINNPFLLCEINGRWENENVLNFQNDSFIDHRRIFSETYLLQQTM